MAEIIGYRRVWSGGCDHCQVASQRLYYKSELLPLHHGCTCGIAPVWEGEDHGLFVQGHVKHKVKQVKDPVLGTKLDQFTPVFVTPEMLDKEFASWHDQIFDEDSEDPRWESLNSYLSGDARELNEGLRSDPQKAADYMFEIGNGLESALKPLDQDVRVYRGINTDKSFYDFAGTVPRVGGVLRDRGFLATTTNRTTAEDFVRGMQGYISDETGMEGILIEIQVEKGTKAAWMTDLDQSELLLERDMQMEIVAVVNDRHVVVKATKSPPDAREGAMQKVYRAYEKRVDASMGDDVSAREKTQAALDAAIEKVKKIRA